MAHLDLGIETCFYDGMDAYVKTWLQFVFPIYIWGVIGLIIVIGERCVCSRRYRIIVEFEFEFRDRDGDHLPLRTRATSTCTCVAPVRRELGFFASPRREEQTNVCARKPK